MQRLDIWLDVACLFKTRSQAQSACKAGKVAIARQRAKAHRLVRLGDELQITRSGWRQLVVVRGFAEHHVPKAAARELYEDLTPAPTPEELQLRSVLRGVTADRRAAGAGAPKKKERREISRLKGRRR